MTREIALTVSFQTPNGTAILNRHLGQSFLDRMGLRAGLDEPFSATLQPQTTKNGRPLLSWDLNGIPLPDGFATVIAVNGQVIRGGMVQESRKGNMMRRDRGSLVVDNMSYSVVGTIVLTKRPYWVKVEARKKSSRGRRSR
jgi:hypothetical protein